MASISKRGKGWQVRWRDPDGQQKARQCPDHTTAVRLKRSVEQACAEGRRWRPEDARPRPDVPTVLRAYLLDRSISRAPRTINRYASNLEIFKRWLRQRQGPRGRLETELLSKHLLTEFYLDLASGGRHGRGRNLDTRRRIVLDVVQAWEWAWDDEEFYEHMPRPRRIEMPRQPGRPTRAPTWSEMDACIAAANGWHRQVAILLRFTGLRVQQVMRLRWEDFDLDLETLRIRGELGKSTHEKRGRLVPISSHLCGELAGWGQREAWVIVSKRQRGGPRERLFRARELGRAWSRAGVREVVWKGRPGHAFRKGFTTELKRSGADSEAVEFLMGRKLEGQRDTYVDPEALGLRDAVGRVPPLSTAPQPMSLDRERARRAL